MQNPKAHKYFFDQQEKNIRITSDDYKQAEMAIKTADAITRSFNIGVYVIDYFRQDVLYMSKNLSEWCGLSEQDQTGNNFGLLP